MSSSQIRPAYPLLPPSLRCRAPLPPQRESAWCSAERPTGRVWVRQPRRPNAPPCLTASGGRESTFEELRVIGHGGRGAAFRAAGPWRPACWVEMTLKAIRSNVIAYEPCNTSLLIKICKLPMNSLVSRTKPLPSSNLLQSGYRLAPQRATSPPGMGEHRTPPTTLLLI